MQRRILVFALSIVGMILGSVSAQKWTKLSPKTSPPGRYVSAMVYDSSRKKMVLFGGSINGGTPVFDDTWEFDGSNWMRKSPSVNPGKRAGHAMAYDSIRNVTVLFGGNDGKQQDDTWEYDGKNWLRRMTPISPPGRFDHSMAYDSIRKRVVMFGGNNNLEDTWEYDGKTWTERKQVIKPSGRDLSAMSFSFSHQSIFLFGGRSGGDRKNDTWEWNGQRWSIKNTTTNPPPRWTHAMVNDILFGGAGPSNVLSDTWEWNGVNWVEYKFTLNPSKRIGHSMTYNTLRQRIILFGGSIDGNTNRPYNDTWIYQGKITDNKLPAAALYETLGKGCRGSNGVPTLSSVGVPSLGSRFSLKLDNLPRLSVGGLLSSNAVFNPALSLRINGAPGCFMYITPIHDTPFWTRLNTTVTLQFTVPNDPLLISEVFFNQAFMYDPSANTLGWVTTNAGKGTVGF